MRDFFICVIFIIFIIIIVCLGVGADYLTSKIECNAKADALGYKCEYHYFSGCVLEKSDGRKVLLQQLREFAE